jgi:6-bladed beta-propeller
MRHRFTVLAIVAALSAVPCSQRVSAQLTQVTGSFTATVLPMHFALNPKAIRVVGDQIYVVSRGDHTVAVYTKTMELVRRIGRIGNGPGELLRPSSVDVDSDGGVWVADEGNNRIQRFDAQGKSTLTFPSQRPQHIRWLRDGTLAVVETFGEELVRLYRADGADAGSISGDVEVPKASTKQVHYFNRPVTTELPNGSLVIAARLIVPPRIRVLRRDSTVLSEVPLPNEHLGKLLDEATASQLQMIQSGGYGGRGVISDVEVTPEGDHLWIAPAAEGLFRYGFGKKSFDYFNVIAPDGSRMGMQDFDFLGPAEIIGISGLNCFTARLR